MDVTARFVEVVRGPVATMPLDEALFLVAAHDHDVDIDDGRRRLDDLAAGCGDGRLDGLRRVLFDGDAPFVGDADDYHHPDNSFLDRVLERRRGLPILLSVVYVEVARRAGVALAGVGLPGHFVVGHFGVTPPVLLDPFAGGAPVAAEHPAGIVRPWHAHEIALRMLNNLVGSYRRRGDIVSAIRAASMRLDLPTGPVIHDAMRQELLAMQAQLN